MAKPKRSAVKAKLRKPRPLTATQQARNVVAPQYGAIDLAQSRSAQQARQQQAALTAARDALVSQLQAGVASSGEQYDAALAQQQALANAGAEGLAAANPNAQIQDTLQSIGAPVEQQQQLGALTQAAFPGQGAVLRVQEGTVPGASLVAQKAGVQQFAAGQPALAGLSGDFLQKGLVAQAQAQRDAYLADRMKIAGQIPGLALDIQEGMDSRQAAALDRAFRAQQAKMDRAFQTRQDQFNRQLETAKLRMAQRELNASLLPEPVDPLDVYKAQTDRISARNSRAAARSRGKSGSKGYQLRTGENGGYMVFDPNTGKVVDTKKGKPGKGKSKFTPYQIQRYKGRAAAIAYDAFKGVPAEGTDPADPPLTYDEAVQEMLRQEVPIEYAVTALNRRYPIKYRVTPHGLVQVGQGGKRKRSRSRKPSGPVGPVG